MFSHDYIFPYLFINLLHIFSTNNILHLFKFSILQVKHWINHTYSFFVKHFISDNLRTDELIHSIINVLLELLHKQLLFYENIIIIIVLVIFSSMPLLLS